MDWIELYNPQTASQTLSGWILRDEDITHQFRIPFSTLIPAGGYWVLCRDTSAFKRFHPEVKNISGNISFGFGGKDQVRLFTSAALLVDSVAYDNDPPWPVEADGKGYSLEILDPSRDHVLPLSWARSIRFGGTPGRSNRLTSVASQPENNLPTRFALEQNYPNPFNPRTQIFYAIPKTGKVRLSVFDLLGKKVLDLVDNQRQPAGRYGVELDGRTLPSGVYFYQVQFIDENGVKQKLVKKMVLIK
jgi:hypothetical protein